MTIFDDNLARKLGLHEDIHKLLAFNRTLQFLLPLAENSQRASRMQMLYECLLRLKRDPLFEKYLNTALDKELQMLGFAPRLAYDRVYALPASKQGFEEMQLYSQIMFGINTRLVRQTSMVPSLFSDLKDALATKHTHTDRGRGVFQYSSNDHKNPDYNEDPTLRLNSYLDYLDLTPDARAIILVEPHQMAQINQWLQAKFVQGDDPRQVKVTVCSYGIIAFTRAMYTALAIDSALTAMSDIHRAAQRTAYAAADNVEDLSALGNIPRPKL